MDDAAFKRLATSDRIVLKSYASTTKDARLGRRFASVGQKNNVLLEIQHRSGVDVQRFSAIPAGQEVILGKDTKLRVVSREWITIGDPRFGKTKRILKIIMKEVL